MSIDVGDPYRCTWTNISPAGGNVTATTVTLTITLPDGTTSVFTPVTPTGTGVYVYDYPTVQAGRHRANWVGTGTNFGAHAEVFDVRPADAPYIVSLADAKAQTNITNTTSDEELRPFIAAATGVIERHLKQAVARRTFTEEVAANGLAVLTWNPVVTLVSVASVDGSVVWNVANLHVTTAGVVTSTSGARLTGRLAVSYIAGMAIIPDEYLAAALIIVQHLWETQRGTSGGPRAGGLGDTLSTPRGTGIGYAIPNRALELLGADMPWVG